MVGYSDDESRLQGWQYMFAGGASGAVTRALCQPLDVLKIRFQLQVEPIANGSKYSSLYQAVRTIIKEESVTALWSGHIPAQYLSISYGFAQFWCYEFLTTKCYSSQSYNTKSAALINFTCGAIAGSFATLISFPFDTIRTRIIAEEKTNRIYKSVWHTFNLMYKTEGKFSLFKGLLPTVAQIAPHSGAQFMFYKLFINILPESISNVSFVNSLTAGSAAGFAAKLFIYPFDLAKKRLQLQGFQHNRQKSGKQFYCKGFIDCILTTMKHEGLLALYKGLCPSLIKASLVSSFHFAFFEEFCQLFRKFNE